MTVDLLPELAQGTARVTRELLDRPPHQQGSPELVDALLNQTRLFLNFIRTYRDGLAAELDEKGKDPDALRRACQISLETLDRTAETRSMLARLLVAAGQKKEFRQQEELAAQVRQTFVDWLEVLDRPFPPLDLKKLEEDARADVVAGRLIRVDTFDDLFPSHADSK